MSHAHRFLVQSALLLAPALAAAQSLETADILKALGVSGDWPTYSGDYSGKRYSLLTEIDRANAGTLTEAWKTKLVTGTKDTKPESGPIVGGIGRFEAGALANIKGSILEVNGILYVSAPDNAWALDARDGHEIWHFVWKTRGGTHIGNRGVGMWHDRIYMETPDDVLLCLQAKSGVEIWHKALPISTCIIFRPQRRLLWAITFWWERVTISTSPDFCSRSIRRRAGCSGSFMSRP